MSTTPQTRYPPLHGQLAIDVAVVGGGITGLTAGLLLKEAGLRVALLEARRIAVGTTGRTTAKITSLHGLIYRHLISELGEEAGRLYAEANQAGLERIASHVSEFSIDCDFRRADAYTFTEQADQAGNIEAEVEASRLLGLPATFTQSMELPFQVHGAVRFERQAFFHPRKYCLALAARIPGDGSHIFEESRAIDVEEGKRLTVITSEGSVEADHVLIATLLPFYDPKGFFIKSHPSTSYALAVKVEAGVPSGMYLSADSPTRSVRPHPVGGDDFLVIEGEEHKTGQEPDTGRRYAALEAWARDTFPVTSISHRWSAQDYMTADRVPYVGPVTSSQRLLVATGFNKWGMSNGTAAAMLLTDLVLGRDNAWFSLFRADRLKPTTTLPTILRENLNVAKRLVGDRLAAMRAPSLEGLGPGEGAVLDHRGEKVAASRDQDGLVHAVSAACTHLGCFVMWNNAEASWDCPCHGSRFTAQGKVLEGPAVKDLTPVDISQNAATITDPSA